MISADDLSRTPLAVRNHEFTNSEGACQDQNSTNKDNTNEASSLR